MARKVATLTVDAAAVGSPDRGSVWDQARAVAYASATEGDPLVLDPAAIGKRLSESDDAPSEVEAPREDDAPREGAQAATVPSPRPAPPRRLRARHARPTRPPGAPSTVSPGLGSRAAECRWNLRTGNWRWDPELFAIFDLEAEAKSFSTAALFAVIHPDDAERSAAALRSVRDGVEQFSHTSRVFRTDGMVRQVAVSGTVAPDPRRNAAILRINVAPMTGWLAPLEWQELSRATDGALMLALRAKMPEALAEAFRRHSPGMLRLAQGLLNNELAAEDVVQNVFEGLFRTPAAFDARRGNLERFLLMRARSRCVDQQRVRGARPARECGPPPSAPAPAVEHEALSQLGSARLRSALGTLAPSERLAIELAFLTGLTYKEVATRSGIPEGTAKSRIRNGLHHLRVSGSLG